jgi:membrane-bound lytic murein transglycosylase A
MIFGAAATLVIVVLAGLAAALYPDERSLGGYNDGGYIEGGGEIDATDPAVSGSAGGSASGGARYRRVTFDALVGWSEDSVSDALSAWQRSCWALLEMPLAAPIGPIANRSSGSLQTVAGVAADWAATCQALAALPDGDDQALRDFITTNMTPVAVLQGNEEAGLFTGYFEPVLSGARQRSDEFAVPLYGLPDDRIRVDLGAFDTDLKGRQVIGKLVDGTIVPYDTRGEIDAGALEDRAEPVFWLSNALDAFILHVQGSARIDLPDGSQARVGFAGHNGHGYRSIARWLIDQGELEAHAASFENIGVWMAAHPDRSTALLAVNPRYIFLREIFGEGPVGATGVPLTARRSLAVDPAAVPLGIPIWLDADPVGDGSGDPIRRLMVTQDTGAAIKGAVRGDFYWGSGAGAGQIARRMSSTGRYYVLLPNEIADALPSMSPLMSPTDSEAIAEQQGAQGQ